MNYCACAKALKKHDKTVGIDVRGRFMRNVVHHQPFTHYPRYGLLIDWLMCLLKLWLVGCPRGRRGWNACSDSD
jgi:hypothetical protein